LAHAFANSGEELDRTRSAQHNAGHELDLAKTNRGGGEPKPSQADRGRNQASQKNTKETEDDFTASRPNLRPQKPISQSEKVN